MTRFFSNDFFRLVNMRHRLINLKHRLIDLKHCLINGGSWRPLMGPPDAGRRQPLIVVFARGAGLPNLMEYDRSGSFPFD